VSGEGERRTLQINQKVRSRQGESRDLRRQHRREIPKKNYAALKNKKRGRLLRLCNSGKDRLPINPLCKREGGGRIFSISEAETAHKEDWEMRKKSRREKHEREKKERDPREQTFLGVRGKYIGGQVFK